MCTFVSIITKKDGGGEYLQIRDGVNIIDIILLLPLLYGASKGFLKGFVVEAATLAGLLLGVIVAIRYSAITEDFLRDFLNITSKYLSYIALGVTFLVVVMLICVLGKVLTKIVDMMSLGLVNKVLGAISGMLKYFIILCVALLIVDALDDKFHFISKGIKNSSLFYNPFLTFARKIYGMIRF